MHIANKIQRPEGKCCLVFVREEVVRRLISLMAFWQSLSSPYDAAAAALLPGGEP